MLSRIDMLPDEALPAIGWVWDRLRERRIPQAALRPILNERLGKLGLAPVSKSAFNRYAVVVRAGRRRPRSTSVDAGAATAALDEIAEALTELALRVAELRDGFSLDEQSSEVKRQKMPFEIAQG